MRFIIYIFLISSVFGQKDMTLEEIIQAMDENLNARAKGYDP